MAGGDAPARACAAAFAATMVGDAIGAPHEGARGMPRDAARRAVEDAVAWRGLGYTDDTQMAWLLLEHVAAAGGRVEPDDYVALLTERVELWRGYGAGMQLLVDAWRRGVPWREAATTVFPEGSFGNGAAMRVAPLGAACAESPLKAGALARDQAEPTHAHPVGIDGAAVVAAAAALAVRRGRFGAAELADVAELAATRAMTAALGEAAALARDLGDPAHEGGPTDRTLAATADRLGTGVTADQSVPLALWIAACAGDVADAVTCALAAGGDVDTIAAMSAAVTAAAVEAGGASPAVDERWVAAVDGGLTLAARVGELTTTLEIAGLDA